MSYVTVTEYTTWLNALMVQRNQVAPVSATDSDYQLFLDEATAYIESQTKRVFTATTATKYFDKHAQDLGKPRLLLTSDLLTVTALVNGDGTTISVSNYYAHPRNGGTRKYAIEITSASSLAWVFNDDYVTTTLGTDTVTF